MIQNKKPISNYWQQSQNHHLLQVNNQTKSKNLSSNQDGSSSASLPSSSQLSKDYEKLRRRMCEMRHYSCVLEFGLGSVAELMKGWAFGGHPEGNFGKPFSNSGTEEGGIIMNHFDDARRSKEVIKGIGEILQDIESCIKSGFGRGENFKMDSMMASTLTGGSGMQAEVEKKGKKSRIFIDEVTPEENSLTTMTTESSELCNIQVVKNTAMFPSYSHKEYIDVNYNNHNNPYCETTTFGKSILPLDALSTLAIVASSKHAEEIKRIGESFVSTRTADASTAAVKSDKSGGHLWGHQGESRNDELRHPFNYADEEIDVDNIPLRKRRRGGGGIKSKANLEVTVVDGDGNYEMSTKKRRTMRQHHPRQ